MSRDPCETCGARNDRGERCDATAHALAETGSDIDARLERVEELLEKLCGHFGIEVDDGE